jgi:hypothetical protein
MVGPFGGPFGLYPAYALWCKESGYQTLGKGRLIQVLERVVIGFRSVPQETHRKRRP